MKIRVSGLVCNFRRMTDASSAADDNSNVVYTDGDLELLLFLPEIG